MTWYVFVFVCIHLRCIWCYDVVCTSYLFFCFFAGDVCLSQMYGTFFVQWCIFVTFICFVFVCFLIVIFLQCLSFVFLIFLFWHNSINNDINSTNDEDSSESSSESSSENNSKNNSEKKPVINQWQFHLKHVCFVEIDFRFFILFCFFIFVLVFYSVVLCLVYAKSQK